MKVRMEACPKCRARGFDVELEELIDADGWLECEVCETALLPVHKELAMQAMRKVSKLGAMALDHARREEVQLDPEKVRQIKKRYYDATSFGRANDRLSRAFSEIIIFLRDQFQAEEFDRLLDAGEFSGPTYARMRSRFMGETARKYKFGTYPQMLQAAEKVCDFRQLYKLGFIFYDPDRVAEEG